MSDIRLSNKAYAFCLGHFCSQTFGLSLRPASCYVVGLPYVQGMNLAINHVNKVEVCPSQPVPLADKITPLASSLTANSQTLS